MVSENKINKVDSERFSTSTNIYKKIFLFLVTIIVLVGIFGVAFPNASIFFFTNFEYILLGTIIILASLILISMLNINFPETDKGYGPVRKIVTIEGYNS